MARDVPASVRTLIDTAIALARRSTSARVAIARAAGVIDVAGLPAEVRGPLQAELDAAVAAACTPLDGREVERVLRDAWRRSPAKVLDDLDLETPLAVRAAAQVHRGEVDGQAVAVKVQRPGLAATTRGDLALLDALAGPLRAVFGALDAGAVLREIRVAAMDELDLEHEASTQRLVSRALRPVAGLVVPKPDLELSHPAVLVSELLDGPTLLDARPDDPAAVAATLVEAHVVAARDGGLALTDARPGHVVLTADGIGLLGAGLARPVDRARVAAGLAVGAALRAGDDAAAAALIAGELDLLDPVRAARAVGLVRAAGGPLLAGPARLDHAALAAMADRGMRDLRAWLQIAATGTPRPEDLLPARGAGQLLAVLATLGVERDWPALL